MFGKDRDTRSVNGRVFVALGFILFGALFLLRECGMKFSFQPWDLWPLVLVFIGVGVLIQSRHVMGAVDGGFLILLGLVFLESNIHFLFPDRRFHWDLLLPLGLIYIGVKILFQSPWSHPHRVVSDDKDSIQVSAVFGGGEYAYDSKTVRGGSVNAVFGGCELDFRRAEMEGEEIVLNCYATFGGIELKVPDHWQVVVKATPMLGGVENKTVHRVNGNPTKILIIQGSAIFGGIEIRN